MIEIRKAADRGVAEHGWLSSRHTFSFAHYDDPEQRGFSDLRVINDDRVAPGQGFGTHPHRDMEILSYVLDGALEHRDTLGNGSVIRPGDVQLMSAGTGIAHSEFNASDAEGVHFLQIWILPARHGIRPGYQQTRVGEEDKRGRLRLVLSPEGHDGALRLHQDARVYAGLFDGAERAELTLASGRAAYVHLARGALSVNGVRLEAGDGLKVSGESALVLSDGEDAEVLVFDLRGPQD
ncbi:pirin family protein [Nitrogeniibacter mangrovi]|uniref:Pirin family protein n=1 Tax=Nitrogeniibacter mangrovi TaxID=2016596 RepID=A0A6C1B6M7_9RHOO|nr:pirin family protein [Nitrogeniibacter mangrovi]QID18368.1 pirin family protein [Nitrogeniibacter mangrovi]